jgi:PAS domain S-box-containing protein
MLVITPDLSQFTELALDGLILVDEAGIVIGWNRPMERLAGRSGKQVIGTPIWNVLYASMLPEMKQQIDLDGLRHLIQKTLSTGDISWHSHRSCLMGVLGRRSPIRVRENYMAIRTGKGYSLLVTVRVLPESSAPVRKKRAQGGRRGRLGAPAQLPLETLLNNPLLIDRSLTLREIDIVSGVLAGKRNAAIAEKLGISEATVKRHLVHIFRKMGLGSRTELIWLLLAPGNELARPTR